MKKIISVIISAFICINLIGQTTEEERDLAFYTATKNWFDAWTLVSRDIFHISKVKPVEFVFFDDKYVYSTSAFTIKKGKLVQGPNLMNLTYKWEKAFHHDSLILPDRSVVPVRLMSFAGEIPNEKKSFFVMPLPSYWQQSGTTSKSFDLDKLVTGVFIHEFSHSQQMQNFGKKLTEFERRNKFDTEFNDDIVQNIFSKDSNYVKLYNSEVEKFYNSVKNSAIDYGLVKEGFQIMQQRQDSYFTDQYTSLKEIDNFFLTMEGLGQYAMYLWLIHPKGGNINTELAMEGVRRGKKWWSQDEGFALFLILDKMTKPDTWANEMFGDKTESVTDLIAKNIK